MNGLGKLSVEPTCSTSVPGQKATSDYNPGYMRLPPTTDIDHCRTNGPLDADNGHPRCNGRSSNEKPIEDDCQFNSDDRAARQQWPAMVHEAGQVPDPGLVIARLR